MLLLYSQGATVAEVRQAMHYSRRWVVEMMVSAKKKLNARNRTHAVALAIIQGHVKAEEVDPD